MDLLLRPTIITGEKRKDDYCVFHEGRMVGRIRLASERSCLPHRFGKSAKFAELNWGR